MTASKNFLVDSFVAGLAIKAPCVAVSASNLTLSGEQTVNGVPVVTKDRVLVIAQTDPKDNGIYNVSTSAWQRAGDFDGNRDVVDGTLVTVISGSTSIFYRCTTPGQAEVGVDDLTFVLLGTLSAQATPSWQSATGDFTAQAEQNYIIRPSTVDIDVDIGASLSAGSRISLHTEAGSGFNAVIDPGSYTINGPVGQVIAPDTLTLAPGETVVLVADGASELEIV